MTTLAKELTKTVERLDKKYGSDDLFVKMMKWQLEEIINQQDLKDQVCPVQVVRKRKSIFEKYQIDDLQNLPIDPVEMAIRAAYGIDWDEDISKETIKRKREQIANKLQADKIYKKPSAYKSGYIVKTYKSLGGTYRDDKATKNLSRWFKEKWADVGNKEYPVYRPTKRLNKLTPFTVNEIDI